MASGAGLLPPNAKAPQTAPPRRGLRLPKTAEADRVRCTARLGVLDDHLAASAALRVVIASSPVTPISGLPQSGHTTR